MSKTNKSMSKTLMIISTVGFISFLLFSTAVFFKVQSSDKPELPSTECILHQKDSTIKILQDENKKLKLLYDNKHDTVIVYKTVFKSKPDTTKSKSSEKF